MGVMNMSFRLNSGVNPFILTTLLSPELFSITSDIPVHALDDFNIGAAGDWGCSSNAEDTVKNIEGKNAEKI
jgi:hypothetical protein